MKNRPWGRDELILALDTYLALKSRTPSPNLPVTDSGSKPVIKADSPIRGRKPE